MTTLIMILMMGLSPMSPISPIYSGTNISSTQAYENMEVPFFDQRLEHMKNVSRTQKIKKDDLQTGFTFGGLVIASEVITALLFL